MRKNKMKQRRRAPAAQSPTLIESVVQLEEPDLRTSVVHKVEAESPGETNPAEQRWFTKWMQTWLPIVLNALILIVIMGHAFYFQKQWDAMKDGLKEARISRELENAAFVGHKNTEIIPLPLTAGSNRKIDITTINTGRTPAFNVTVKRDWIISPIPYEDFVPPTTKTAFSGRTTVLPGVDAKVGFWLDLTQADLDAVNQFQKFIYLWGTVNYDDVFGRSHWTKFCVMHHPPNGAFDACPHGNESDYQYLISTEKERSPN